MFFSLSRPHTYPPFAFIVFFFVLAQTVEAQTPSDVSLLTLHWKIIERYPDERIKIKFTSIESSFNTSAQLPLKYIDFGDGTTAQDGLINEQIKRLPLFRCIIEETGVGCRTYMHEFEHIYSKPGKYSVKKMFSSVPGITPAQIASQVIVDIGKHKNSLGSPVSVASPYVQLPFKGKNTYHIPVAQSEHTHFRCRFLLSEIPENNPPVALTLSKKCNLEWNPRAHDPGWKGLVKIAVDSSGENKLKHKEKSSSYLQFYFNGLKSDSTIYPPLSYERSCVVNMKTDTDVRIGETFLLRGKQSFGYVGTLITMGAPAEMTFGTESWNVYGNFSDFSPFDFIFTWKPTLNDANSAYAVLSIPAELNTGRAAPLDACSFPLIASMKEPRPQYMAHALAFTLIDADKDEPVYKVRTGPYVRNNEQLTLRFLPPSIAFEVNTIPKKVGSVKIIFDGKQRIDNDAPYAVFGDTDGDFDPWGPLPGKHTLTAIPYVQKDAKGIPGTPYTVDFIVR